MPLSSVINTPTLQNTPGKESKRSESAVEVVQNSMVDFLDAPGQAAYYKHKFAQLAKLRETDVEKELVMFKDVAQERIDLLEAKVLQLTKRCEENGLETSTVDKVDVSEAGKKATAEARAVAEVNEATEKELDDMFCKLVFYERVTGMKVDGIESDVVSCTFNEDAKFSFTFVDDDKVEYRMKEDKKDYLPAFLKQDIKFGVDALPKILGNIYFKIYGVDK